jgi:hypothetical protein
MSRRRGGAVAVSDLGGDPASPTAQVRAAMMVASPGAGTGKRRNRGNAFAFDKVSRREAFVAPLLGIYLGFAIARLHERFPVLEVPGLLWGLMIVMLLTLVASVPSAGWKRTWQASPQLRLVALIALLAVVTMPLGIWMRGSLDALINRFTIPLAVYVACIFLLRDHKVLRRIVALYVICTSVVATANLIDYFTGDTTNTALTAAERITYQETGEVNPDLLRQRFGSVDPNDIAAVMATTLPLALWLSVGSFTRRLIWLPCTLVLVGAVIPTESRGGLLGLVAVAIVLILVGAKGWKRIIMIGTIASCAAVFMILAGGHLDRMGEFGGSDYNYTDSEGRIAIWKRGIVWMIRRPWGYGLENFPVYFGWLNGPERAAHNSLIQYGVELGVLGLAAYLLICGTLVKSMLAIRRNALHAGANGQYTVMLTGHMLAMLAASFTTGFFLSQAYYPMTYMTIGICSAIVLSATDAPQLAAAAPPPATGPAGRRQRQLKAFQSA